MADKTQDESDYKVGKGKPPKHTQWKKGQSGNPSGKPKKEASLKAKLKKLASEEVVVQQNGVPVTMTKDEAMLVSVLMKAMKGDLPSARFVVETLGVESEAAAAESELEVGEADLGVLERYTDWVGVLEQARAERDGSFGEGDGNEGS